MRESIWRWIAVAGLATGSVALAGTVVLWLRMMPEVGTRASDAAPAAALPRLDGRTGVLSRILAERRAVARIRLRFGAGGVLAASCLAEAAEGGVAACFAAAESAGTWALRDGALCLAAAAIDLADATCYALSGSDGQWTLAGPGLLAGTMQLR